MDDLLSDLILSAGNQVALARLLGVEKRCITDWKRAGRISQIGALLVAKSRLLGPLFPFTRLRPDLTPAAILDIETRSHYREARLRQLQYESSPEYTRSTLGYLYSRLNDMRMA